MHKLLYVIHIEFQDKPYTNKTGSQCHDPGKSELKDGRSKTAWLFCTFTAIYRLSSGCMGSGEVPGWGGRWWRGGDRPVAPTQVTGLPTCETGIALQRGLPITPARRTNTMTTNQTDQPRPTTCTPHHPLHTTPSASVHIACVGSQSHVTGTAIFVDCTLY